MSFAHPWALLLLLLLIPVGLLYWLRQRVPRAVVGTGLFWQKALAEEPLRARWQRWRTPISLVLHSLTVVLFALAAAGPSIPPAQRIVLILDNSATMRAKDGYDTRFDTAKTTAKRMIESLRSCDEMAIVTTIPAPLEVQPSTSNHALLCKAVDSIQAQAESPAIDWAIKLAREIGAMQKPPARIVLVTDASARDAVQNDQARGLEVVRVGDSADNRAITCFTARRSKFDPARCDVLVAVENFSDHSAQAKIELSIDDKPSDTAPLAMEQDSRWQHLFELKLPTSARLTAKLAPADAYPFDDTVQLDVPAPPATEVAGFPLTGSVHGTDLRVPADIGKAVSAATFASQRMPLWISLAATAALLLILEWCLYQRRWTS